MTSLQRPGMVSRNVARRCRQKRCGGSLATPGSLRSSPTVNSRSLTSAVNNEPLVEQYEKCWCYATRDADSRAVTPHPAGPTDTTSPIGSTVERPQPQTDACCVADTSTTSTKANGPSPATPTTNCCSPHLAAPYSPVDHPASPPKPPPDTEVWHRTRSARRIGRGCRR